MTAEVHFDPAAHLYTVCGTKLPSVTQILADAGLVDYSWCDEEAAWRGSAIHRAIEYDMGPTGLDFASVPEAFQPYIHAARQALADYKATPVHVELRLHSKLYRFAGTADVVVRMADGKLALWDWKTGAPNKATALQTAAYAMAYWEQHTEPIADRRAIQLRKDGTYKPTEYPDHYHDRENFLAALAVAKLRREWGFIKEANA